MNTKQLETGLKLIEALYQKEKITQMEYWEMEGAIIDLFNGDGWDFFQTLKETLQDLTTELLITIGYLPTR
jgi:hypothetical protein